MNASKLTHAEAVVRGESLSVLAYDVTLDLTDGAGGPADRVFGSRTVVEFTSAIPTTFIDVMPDSLSSVRLNGRDVEPVVKDGRLALDELQAHNVLVVEGLFELSDEAQGLQQVVDPADGETYFVSMMFMAAAQRVFACFDQPDLKGPYTFHVTAPAAWEVVSCGSVRVSEPAPGGALTRHFTTTQPIPTYITAVLAGPYHRVSDTVMGPGGPIELGLLCIRSAAPHLDVERCLRWTKAGFDLFHESFDHPYPFEKYDQVFGTEPGSWGMENAGAVTLGNGFVFRSPPTDIEQEEFAYTVLHELSHMWFGNLVTTRWWQDSWLNEAFATFAGYHAMVEVTEFAEAWTSFAQEAKVKALHADQLPSTHPISADVPDLHTALSNFDNITYHKGASVLRQLAAYVGWESFERGLRDYFRAHAYGSTGLTDLLTALEQASGRDLVTWSQQWLESAQVNTLQPELTVGEDGTYASFAIIQDAHPDHPVLRSHRLTVGLYDGTDDVKRVQRIELDVDGPRTEVPELIGLPASPLVVVNDEDLTFAKVRFDPASEELVRTRVGAIADPLAQSVVWTALWDMARDGELRPRDYVDAVLGGIGGVAHPTVLAGLLGNVERTLTDYLAPATAGDAREWLADLAWATINDAEPGSDRQKLWLRTFARVGASTSRATDVSSLYRGSSRIDGVELDFETRWLLLQGLVPYGLAGADDIEAELARDANTTSEQYAATARALLPTSEAKAAAWALITTRGGGQMSLKYSAAHGFWHAAQAGLLLPYVTTYFESIEDFWALDEGGEHAHVATSSLAPRIVDPEVARHGEAWLARSGQPAMLRRTVIENHDELLRSLRNRSLDGR